MIRHHHILFLLVGLLSLVGMAHATTRYVSTAGSDGTSCAASQSPANPKRNLTGVNGAIKCMAGGDTLYLRQGTYFEQIDANVDPLPGGGGSWATATTVASYPGETATLAIAGCCINGAILSFPPPPTQNGWLVFDRLVLDASNSRYGGAIITDHVRFQNGEVKKSGLNFPFHVPFDPGQDECQGFALGGPFSEVINSEIHHSPHSYGFYVTGHHNVISNNSIHDNGGFAVQIYEGNFPGVTTSNHLVSNNRIYNNGYYRNYPGMTVGEGHDNLVVNNLFYDNFAAIWVYKNGTRTTVVNNTFYNNTALGIQIYDPNTNAEVRNNIIIGSAGPAVDDQGTGSTITNNITTAQTFAQAGAKGMPHLARATVPDALLPLSVVASGLSSPWSHARLRKDTDVACRAVSRLAGGQSPALSCPAP